jgi:hypothetical protein
MDEGCKSSSAANAEPERIAVARSRNPIAFSWNFKVILPKAFVDRTDRSQ